MRASWKRASWKVRASVRARKGQSMTEYAMIMSAVAVVAYAAYLSFGQVLVSLLGNVTTSL